MIFIVVTGIGTCGSSAVGGILFYLGVNMGIRVKPASVVNPKGYFEDLEYFEAIHHHDQLGISRREAIYQWFLKRVGDVPPLILGLKAPHFIDVSKMTMDEVRKVVPDVDVRYILVERSLEEIAQSKMMKYPRPNLTIDDYREKVSLIKRKMEAFLLWNEQEDCRPMLRVSYDDLLADRRKEIRRIADFSLFGLPDMIVARMTNENMISKAETFVDPGLKRFFEQKGEEIWEETRFQDGA